MKIGSEGMNIKSDSWSRLWIILLEAWIISMHPYIGPGHQNNRWNRSQNWHQNRCDDLKLREDVAALRRYTDEKQEEKEEYQKFADQLVHTILQNAQQSEKIEFLSKEIQNNQAHINEKVDQMKELRRVFIWKKQSLYIIDSKSPKEKSLHRFRKKDWNHHLKFEFDHGVNSILKIIGF